MLTLTDADHAAGADAPEQLIGELELLRQLPRLALDPVAIDLAVGAAERAHLLEHAGGDQVEHHASTEVRLVAPQVFCHVVVGGDHDLGPSPELGAYQKPHESDAPFSTNIQTALFEQRGQNAALHARATGDGAAAPRRDLFVLDLRQVDAGGALGFNFLSMKGVIAKGLLGGFELRGEFERFKFWCGRCRQLGSLSESELLTGAARRATDQVFGSRPTAFRALDGPPSGAIVFSGVDLLHSRFEDLEAWGKKKSSVEAQS